MYGNINLNDFCKIKKLKKVEMSCIYKLYKS